MERRIAPELNAKRRVVPELDQQKSQVGLGEIYEQEFLQQAGVAVVEDKVKAQHEAIRTLFQQLCYKLDALSNYRFTPKPVRLFLFFALFTSCSIFSLFLWRSFIHLVHRLMCFPCLCSLCLRLPFVPTHRLSVWRKRYPWPRQTHRCWRQRRSMHMRARKSRCVVYCCRR